MQRRSWPAGLVVKALACATAYPSPRGALIRFYIRRDSVAGYNGTLGVRRAELRGVMELRGIRPSRPRRLYSFTAEWFGLGDE